ncbi:Uncharacterised protein [Vibrio cholerae]|nr:Uncharacterised protein [Vibrio cholerae]CSI04288.1 Uncharacterised protein [Vibrio cholerae]
MPKIAAIMVSISAPPALSASPAPIMGPKKLKLVP